MTSFPEKGASQRAHIYHGTKPGACVLWGSAHASVQINTPMDGRLLVACIALRLFTHVHSGHAVRCLLSGRLGAHICNLLQEMPGNRTLIDRLPSSLTCHMSHAIAGGSAIAASRRPMAHGMRLIDASLPKL